MSQTKHFADLHCHPADMVYHKLRGKQNKQVITDNPKEYHPWNRKIVEKFLKQTKGKRAGQYLQSNPPKLMAGRTTLAFASLYPLEEGFVAKFKGVHSVGNFIARLPILRKFVLMINRTVLNMTTERYSYLKSDNSDYYDELQAMYQFYVNGHNIWQSKHLLEGDEDKMFTIEVAGEYELCKHFNDVQRVINEPLPMNPEEKVVSRTAIVLTIEGLHAFGFGHADEANKDVDFSTFKQRIIDWKKNREFPIFFITFSHHFNNRLCGHAHSLPKITRFMLNQRHNMGAGFSNDGRGEEVVELLLNMGQFANNPAMGKRILIDVKHMSPAGRQRFYQMVNAHNQSNPQDKIPVIASHVGYSGAAKLTDHFGQGKNLFGKETDSSFKDGHTIDGDLYSYNPWGINMCAEDVVEIVRSKGLLGISMDQRVMAAKKTTKMTNKGSKELQRKRKTRVILNNLLGMLTAVFTSQLNLQEREHAWDAITLGTDFDGYIDPIDNYPTCKHFATLHKDLTAEIQAYNSANPNGVLVPWKGREEELVDKIGFSNAFNFLQKHFN